MTDIDKAIAELKAQCYEVHVRPTGELVYKMNFEVLRGGEAYLFSGEELCYLLRDEKLTPQGMMEFSASRK